MGLIQSEPLPPPEGQSYYRVKWRNPEHNAQWQHINVLTMKTAELFLEHSSFIMSGAEAEVAYVLPDGTVKWSERMEKE